MTLIFNKFCSVTFVFLFAFVLFLIPASAQKGKTPRKTDKMKTSTVPACDLTIDNSPVLRGVRLGMSPSEVRKALNLEDEASEVGSYVVDKDKKVRQRVASSPVSDKQFDSLSRETRFSLFSDAVPAKASNLRGINSASIGFFDDRLFRLQFSYQNRNPEWSGIAEFLEFNAAKLNIPKNLWIINENSAAANCRDYWAQIKFSPENIVISLYDLKLMKRSITEQKKLVSIREQREKIPEFEKKQQFQP